jgi:DTW domain-containing protein YfiP
MHPIEQKRRIATGRMSHLTLENSELIIGEDFTHNDRVSQLATSQRHHAVILYPGARSQCLSHLTSEERRQIVPNDKALTVFVIDGTWATARKMVRKSLNLHHLPRVCFQPQAPSRFRVRKQPAPECFSTIEAIHQVIELMGESQGFVTALRQHDALLRVFDSMVEKQLQFIENVKHRPDRYRRSS